MANLGRKLDLWRLLASAREGIGLRDISLRLGVSKNTAQRDIDELSRSGVAVQEARSGQALRFFVREGPPATPKVDPAGFVALEAAEVALAPYGDLGLARSVRRLRSQLAGAFGQPAAAPVFDGPKDCSSTSVSQSMVECLITAIQQQRRCRISYRARFTDASRVHEVEPHSVFLGGGLLYLLARVPPHRGPTTFAAHLIESVEVMDAKFQRRSWRRTGFRVFDEEPRAVAVRFSSEVAPFIAERVWHPSQRLRHLRDGGLVFRARLSGKYEFLGWVLSWSPFAELLSPADWRQTLSERASGTVAIHKLKSRRSGLPSLP